MKTRKQIRKDRLWKHFKSFLPNKVFGPDFKEIKEYNPEDWREAFFKFQSLGKKVLTESEIYYIEPLIMAQKNKEITLSSLAEESMEWWADHRGWIYPWLSTLDGKLDRLTRVAILKTVHTASKDIVSFFQRHPGISEETKQKYFTRYVGRVGN